MSFAPGGAYLVIYLNELVITSLLTAEKKYKMHR